MIPLARPWFDAREREAIVGPLETGWVTQGPEVAAFEREFAEFVGAEHACAVSNGTSALALALEALGIGTGDEVITVSLSFVATANVVRRRGALPVFVDVKPGTFNIDPEQVRAALGPNTRAILCVHQVGMPCDLAALTRIAAEADVPLIEDAACAIGSEIEVDGRWQKVGAPHGLIACFSFHPRKLLTTGDGGMLTTADAELHSRFQSLRQHGVSQTQAAGPPQYVELGFNYRMTDIQGALGRVQLRKIPEMVRTRRRMVGDYRRLLADVPGIEVASEPRWARSNWQSFLIRLPDWSEQETVIAVMRDLGVATGRGITCAHREPVYQGEPWRCVGESEACDCAGGCEALAQSEVAQDRWLMLPLFHQLTASQREQVVGALREATAQSGSS